MVQSAKPAATKDAPIRLNKKDYVASMVQNANLAATKDAPNRPKQEECVTSIVQSKNLAAMKDATNRPTQEEYVASLVAGSIPESGTLLTKKVTFPKYAHFEAVAPTCGFPNS